MESIKTGEYSPEKIAELRERIAVLEEANRALLSQVSDLSMKSYYDKLTGLMSRAAFEEEMERLSATAFRDMESQNERRKSDDEKENFVLAIFDVDYFKRFNDTYGHQTGDKVLKIVAQTIRSYVRNTDVVARWGGEEIAVVFNNATLSGAELKANFIRQKISEISSPENPEIKITVSAGLANSSVCLNKEDVFARADEALYQSKEAGRNRVTSFSMSLQKS